MLNNKISIMKKTFEIFKKSLSDVSLYREAREAPLKVGIRYYIKAIFLLSLFATVAFGVFSVPQGVRFMKEEASLLVQERYPTDLVVTFKNGEASTNSASPSFIPGEKKTLKTLFNDDSIENILVIDTGSEYDGSVFDNYHTFALLTKHDLVMRGVEERVTIQPLRGIPEMTITSASLINFIEKLNNSLALFVVLSLVIVFALLFVGYLVYLVPLALFALIPYFLAWIKNIPLTYRGAYKMSVYAVVPGLALKTLFSIGGVFLVPAYFSLLIFMLVVFLVMKRMEQ